MTSHLLLCAFFFNLGLATKPESIQVQHISKLKILHPKGYYSQGSSRPFTVFYNPPLPPNPPSPYLPEPPNPYYGPPNPPSPYYGPPNPPPQQSHIHDPFIYNPHHPQEYPFLVYDPNNPYEVKIVFGPHDTRTVPIPHPQTQVPDSPPAPPPPSLVYSQPGPQLHVPSPPAPPAQLPSPFSLPEEVPYQGTDDFYLLQQELARLKMKALPLLPNPDSHNCEAIGGIPRKCMRRNTCFHTYSLYVVVDKHSTCILPHGEIGVCCPQEDFFEFTLPYEYEGYYEGASIRNSRSTDYETAFQAAEKEVQDWEKRLKKIEVAFTSSPDKLHQDMLRTTPEAFAAARQGMVLLRTKKILNGSLDTNSRLTSLSKTRLKSACREVPECSLSPYRSIDGTCNNLLFPLWGSTNSGFHRMIEPDYADGIETPRRAKNGQELPHGRFMSLKYIKDYSASDPALSHMTMAFGQLVAHDLSRLAVYTKPGDKVISCCTPEVLSDPKKQHPACYPIKLERDDPQYGDHPCMEFVRAAPAQPDDCKLTYRRDPMNQVTHALDGSYVYGSDHKTLDKLRSKTNGLLKVSELHGNEMLPHRNSSTCGNPTRGYHCFDSGDVRVNQQPPILCVHVVFHREHNRLAKQLHLTNPHWPDEKLFQEARKILIAQIQHITFNEFLPLFVDHTTRLTHGLLLRSGGYSNNYNPHLKPNILCAFQAAAFRIGHTLIKNSLALFHHGHFKGGIYLKDHYFNPNFYYSEENKIDYILNGLLNEASKARDGHFSHAVTRELFKKGTNPGLDLYAINLQRGRDIGLNGYNKWRVRCGLTKAYKFLDFSDAIADEHIHTLKEVYTHVDDVDLYTAGVMETPIHGLLVGPTFRCIIANQFQRIKIADRFWYERYSAEEGVGFTPDQLKEIRKTTLSRILCLNTKINQLQPLALLQTSPT